MRSARDPDSRLALRSHWRVVAQGAGATQLMSEFETQIWVGDAFEHLIGLLDGSHRRHEVIRELARVVPEEAATAALESLESAGLLREGASDRPREDAYWELLDPGAIAVSTSNTRLTAAVTSIGGNPVPRLESALALTPDFRDLLVQL